MNNYSKIKSKILGSSCAALSEIAIFHPVDTITKRMMVNKEKEINFNKILSNNKTFNFQNISQSLYQGIGYASLYKVTQRVYKYAGQSIINEKLSKHYNKTNNNVLINGLSGSLVGLGETALIPLDILKIKRQTNPESFKNRNFFQIINQERFNLYRGFSWTLMRNIPGSFALFGGYSAFQTMFYNNNNENLSWLQTSMCSLSGSFCSLGVSAPFDVIKTRIQKDAFQEKTSGIKVFKNLVKNEGYKYLFRGLTPKLLTIGPKLVFSLTVSKKLMSYFSNLNNNI